MKNLTKGFIILITCLSLAGISAGSALAANDDTQKNNKQVTKVKKEKKKKKKKKKKKVVWCPKVKFVCKPCDNNPIPPTSTVNPEDICCSYEIVGWRQCGKK